MIGDHAGWEELSVWERELFTGLNLLVPQQEDIFCAMTNQPGISLVSVLRGCSLLDPAGVWMNLTVTDKPMRQMLCHVALIVVLSLPHHQLSQEQSK